MRERERETERGRGWLLDWVPVIWFLAPQSLSSVSNTIQYLYRGLDSQWKRSGLNSLPVGILDQDAKPRPAP